ncbi:hypothetical protein FMUND_11327 [Fusarium mundagurra]|uniref:Prion-inhibition and propagation HeLo domain-containing protein n=1 Tax=Fusarium mundagurra TaxID=1567541 RepID=A0A8H5Y915_9HYPO|nr:hypothetical protein FMUND_11327 [Fusarium mundagurra]
MISASRRVGRDVEILETKLDVERMLLLQWADRVGLLKTTEQGNKLQNPEVQQTITRDLFSIQNLLSEGQALEKRYGLERSHYPHAAVNSHQLTSASPMERFLREFANLGLDGSKSGGSNKPKTATAIQTVRWIIVDKENFSQLISDLSYFTSRLHVLITEAPMDTARMTGQDSRDHDDVSSSRCRGCSTEESRPGEAEATGFGKYFVPIWRTSSTSTCSETEGNLGYSEGHSRE